MLLAGKVLDPIACPLDYYDHTIMCPGQLEVKLRPKYCLLTLPSLGCVQFVLLTSFCYSGLSPFMRFWYIPSYSFLMCKYAHVVDDNIWLSKKIFSLYNENFSMCKSAYCASFLFNPILFHNFLGWLVSENIIVLQGGELSSKNKFDSVSYT